MGCDLDILRGGCAFSRVGNECDELFRYFKSVECAIKDLLDASDGVLINDFQVEEDPRFKQIWGSVDLGSTVCGELAYEEVSNYPVRNLVC